MALTFKFSLISGAILITALMVVLVWLAIMYITRKVEDFTQDTKMQRLTVFTVITDASKREFKILEESAKAKGIKLQPILSDTPIGHSVGFGAKITLFHDAIKDLPADDLVMFVDGYDVLFCADSDEIINKFESMNIPSDMVLFSAERACWPVKTPYENLCTNAYKREGLPDIQTPYKYLNSGMYMGRVGAIRNIISPRLGEIEPGTDDQGFYAENYTGLTPGARKIVLDSESVIFQNLVEEPEGNIAFLPNEKRWMNVTTKTKPSVFQGNGPSKNELFDVMWPRVAPPKYFNADLT